MFLRHHLPWFTDCVDSCGVQFSKGVVFVLIDQYLMFSRLKLKSFDSNMSQVHPMDLTFENDSLPSVPLCFRLRDVWLLWRRYSGFGRGQRPARSCYHHHWISWSVALCLLNTDWHHHFRFTLSTHFCLELSCLTLLMCVEFSWSCANRRNEWDLFFGLLPSLYPRTLSYSSSAFLVTVNLVIFRILSLSSSHVQLNL